MASASVETRLAASETGQAPSLPRLSTEDRAALSGSGSSAPLPATVPCVTHPGDVRHRPHVPGLPCCTGHPVRTKLIAACLMLTMATWVESLALPVAMAAHSTSPAPRTAGYGHDHACCHQHAQLPVPQLPTPAPGGNQHRCCFLRAPQAAPVSAQKSEKPTSASANLNPQPEPEPTVPTLPCRSSSVTALAILSRMSVILRN